MKRNRHEKDFANSTSDEKIKDRSHSKRRNRSNSSSSTCSSLSSKKLIHSKKKVTPTRSKFSSSSGSSSRRSSCSSSTDSDKKYKKKLKREKKKAKKLKKKLKKEKKLCKNINVGAAESKDSDKNEDCNNDVPIELMEKCKAMAPMTKEEWEKRQSVVRRVYDEESGRYRLIKGDGEIIEEIVSRDRHKVINKEATQGDGNFFQAKLASNLTR